MKTRFEPFFSESRMRKSTASVVVNADGRVKLSVRICSEGFGQKLREEDVYG